jgi:hypothetical protein
MSKFQLTKIKKKSLVTPRKSQFAKKQLTHTNTEMTDLGITQ